MDALIEPNFSVTWTTLLIRIAAALLIGGAIGIEREYKSRPAGMRTHVLVCLGATMIATIECMTRYGFNVESVNNVTMTFGRLSAQVVSGLGFLGAGTIFTAQKKIIGLTTAASLWNVGCMGLMIGFGYYWAAMICGLIVLIVLTLLQRLIHVNAVKHVEIKYQNRAETNKFITDYFEMHQIKVLDMDFHIESGDNGTAICTNLYTLHLPNKITYTDIVSELSEYPDISTVRTRNT